ncbi:hypothetical protein [Sagittula salina]|nr:hypothetical protein [Sagittula salina]
MFRMFRPPKSRAGDQDMDARTRADLGLPPRHPTLRWTPPHWWLR